MIIWWMKCMMHLKHYQQLQAQSLSDLGSKCKLPTYAFRYRNSTWQKLEQIRKSHILELQTQTSAASLLCIRYSDRYATAQRIYLWQGDMNDRVLWRTLRNKIKIHISLTQCEFILWTFVFILTQCGFIFWTFVFCFVCAIMYVCSVIPRRAIMLFFFRSTLPTQLSCWQSYSISRSKITLLPLR